MVERRLITIGTRGSPLALAQAYEVQQLLKSLLGWEEGQLPLQIIKTTGDLIQDRSLMDAGGKGLFTKELDQALINRTIDIAVHSAKDLPTEFPESISFIGCLKREDVRDAFICINYPDLKSLPQNALVGTASLRRQALLKHIRPDLRITLLRGNVQTRLKRLEEGVIDATLLAMAGLNRLHYECHAREIFDSEVFLPAVGQGAIALTVHEDDLWVKEIIKNIIHLETTYSVHMERAFLKVLDGSCRMPVAGFARKQENMFVFEGRVLRPDGSEVLATHCISSPEDVKKKGAEAGLELKQRMPQGFLDQ